MFSIKIILNIVVLFFIWSILIISVGYSSYINAGVDNISNSSTMIKSKNLIKDDYVQNEDNFTFSQKETANKEVIVIDAFKYSPIITTFSPAAVLESLYVSDSAEYLKNIPGFTTVHYGGVNNDLLFRGMFGSRIRVLINNSEILGACCSRMDPPTSYICPETFDILNLIKGPQTVLLGPVTSGCILQFERYHPNFKESKIQLFSNITIGKNNKIDRNIDSCIESEHGYARIINNVSYSDDYCDGKKFLVHSAWYKWNTDVILFLNLGRNTCCEISVGQGNGTANYASRDMDALCLARDSYGITLETTDISNFLDKVELQAWCNYINHTMTSKCHSDNSGIFQKKCCNNTKNTYNYLYRNIWGTRSIITCQWNNVQCHSGIDIQVNQNAKNLQNDVSGITNTFFSKDSGIFSELVLDVLPNKKITGGLRLEYSIVNFNNFNKSKQYNILYPAGFLRYEYNNNSSLFYYIGIGTSKRIPEYWELFYKKLDESNLFFKDSVFLKDLLKPEDTVQIDFGTYFKFLQVDGWLSSYFGYIKNYILCNYIHDYITLCDKVCYISNVDAAIYGTEMALSYKYSDCWYLQGNLSWNNGMNISNHCILPTIPPLEGRLSCQWKWNTYIFSLAWRLVTASPLFNISNLIYSNECKNNSLPGFGVISLNLVWNGIQNFKFSVGIDNLFNRVYREYLSGFHHTRLGYGTDVPIYEPGRVWWIKVGMKLQ